MAMNESNHFKFSTGVIAYPVFFILLIWVVFWFEVRFSFNFSKYGIYPHTTKGLRGIVFSPFIHGGVMHLYHNTTPLFVLSAALFYFYRKIAWKVILLGVLVSGFLTWCLGRPSYHIGASGLIYVLISFCFFKGLLSSHYRLVALSLLIVFLYGSMIWYALPLEQGVSWEGHLSGLVTGLIFAFIFRKHLAKPKKYVWEQDSYNEDMDPFLKHFDEQGNFVPSTEPKEDPEQPLSHYVFKENKN